jgi:hypothetical protein
MPQNIWYNAYILKVTHHKRKEGENSMSESELPEEEWPTDESWAICPRCDGRNTVYLQYYYNGFPKHACDDCEIEFYG